MNYEFDHHFNTILSEDSQKYEIEEEIEYWEEQFGIAAEIGHKEGKQQILALLAQLEEWRDG